MVSTQDQIFSKIPKPACFSDYLGLRKILSEYCAAIIFGYLRREKRSLKPGDNVEVASLMREMAVKIPYQSFVYRMLEILEIGGYVKSGEGKFHVIRIEEKNEDFFRFQAQTMFPKLSPFFSLIQHCSESYHDVISGKTPAASVLFPPSNPHLIPDTLRSIPMIGFQNASLIAAQKYVILHQNTRESLNILEVGGGQGILTEQILPIIDFSKTRYRFTDISEYFVRNAKKKWASRYPTMEYDSLDISVDSRSENLKVGQYDIILAFNVVHATQNISTTLANLFKMIKTGGSLCLIEDVQSLPWIDLIYGITKEWWEHEDDLRKFCPHLSIEQWKIALHLAGFNVESIYPNDFYDDLQNSEVDVANFFCKKLSRITDEK